MKASPYCRCGTVSTPPPRASNAWEPPTARTGRPVRTALRSPQICHHLPTKPIHAGWLSEISNDSMARHGIHQDVHVGKIVVIYWKVSVSGFRFPDGCHPSQLGGGTLAVGMTN